MPVLVDAARRRARDTPDAPLIDAPAERRVVTAGELGADACATAAALRGIGIGPGHAVAAHVGNRSGYFSLLLACLDVGAALLRSMAAPPRPKRPPWRRGSTCRRWSCRKAARAPERTSFRAGCASPAAPIRRGRSRPPPPGRSPC